MKTLDNYLCAQFQKLSDWLQDNTGKNCFWYAMAFLLINTSIDVYHHAFVHDSKGWMIFDFVGFVLYLFGVEHAKATVSPSKQTMNPYGTITRFIRLMGLWFLPLEIIMFPIGDLRCSACMLLGNVTCLAFLYFLSCTPRPWSKNFAGKWLDALAGALFGKLVPSRT